jgi:hypothetical protein
VDLKAVQEAVAQGNYLYSQHALQRMIDRHITRAEVEQAITTAEMIEDYPLDKGGPSCLIYGETEGKRALHVQVSAAPSVKIVTAYEPDPAEWENLRVRKS